MSMGSRAATGWERFFWAVFNKSTNPMSLLDEQRVRVAVNAALCEFLQRPRAALVGGRIDEIVRPNELKSLAAEWDRFMRVGDWTGDREVIRADGVAIRAQYAGRAAEIDGRRLVVFVIVPGEIDVIPENGVSAELTPRERS